MCKHCDSYTLVPDLDFRSRSENNRMSEEEREIDVELDVSSKNSHILFPIFPLSVIGPFFPVSKSRSQSPPCNSAFVEGFWKDF